MFRLAMISFVRSDAAPSFLLLPPRLVSELRVLVLYGNARSPTQVGHELEARLTMSANQMRMFFSTNSVFLQTLPGVSVRQKSVCASVCHMARYLLAHVPTDVHQACLPHEM